ncbi:hypothetical protein AAEP93_001882 [Penicillium crustosum]
MAALIDGMIALRTEKRVDAAFDQGLRREVTDWRYWPYPRFKNKADKETVDLPHAIPSPNNEQLELLIQLRVRAAERPYLRRMTLRVAAHQMSYLEGMINDDASSDILVLRTLEHIMANLMHRLIALREEEEADVALEEDLWHQVTG